MWRLAAVLLCITINIVQAQEPAKSSDPNAAAQATSNNAIPAISPFIGKWKGEWVSDYGRARGQMEIEVAAINGDSVTGQVKVGTSATPACSPAWEALLGTNKGEKISARYDLRGRCGKADLVFSIEPAGNILIGTYTSEYPDKGNIRLTRQP